MKRARLACLTVSTVLAASSLVTARQAPAPQTAPTAAPAARGAQGGRGAAPVESPEIGADQRVTFRLRAPEAKEVAVAFGGKRVPMQKDDQGVWSATSDAMKPDIYTYSLVVDGTSINDPANRQVQTSYGSFQSMFVIPGPDPWLPAAGVPRGAVTRHVFHSAVANDERDFFVYTPAGYDVHRAQAYPVLYLLHGLGDDAERWLTGGGGASNIFDNLIAQKKALPMVVVTPLGYGTSTGPAGGRTAENLTGYAKILLDEVMPVVDRAYNVSKNRDQRAIAGLSMGGAESLYVGLNHLDRFAWIGAFSSAPMLFPPAVPALAAAPAGRGGGRGAAPPPMDPAVFSQTFPTLDAKANPQIRMLWIVCGTADGLIGANRQFKDWLKSKNVQFTEQEVPDMAHVWPLWRQNLTDMAPRLFQAKSR
jgi:enterochelin esterase-like enzyme